MQESLEGTQAEADALMEESAFGFMNNQQDEGHEERAWGCVVLNTSTTTFQAVASALGWPYDAWTKSKVSELHKHCNHLNCCESMVEWPNCAFIVY